MWALNYIPYILSVCPKNSHSTERITERITFTLFSWPISGGANTNISLISPFSRKIIVAHVLFIIEELFQSHHLSKIVPWHKGQKKGKINGFNLGWKSTFIKPQRGRGIIFIEPCSAKCQELGSRSSSENQSLNRWKGWKPAVLEDLLNCSTFTFQKMASDFLDSLQCLCCCHVKTLFPPHIHISVEVLWWQLDRNLKNCQNCHSINLNAFEL